MRQRADSSGKNVDWAAGDGEIEWPLYFADERFDSALDLIDSALPTIEREVDKSMQGGRETK